MNMYVLIVFFILFLVAGIDQFKFHGNRPTPNELSLFLQDLQVFQDSDGQNLDYEPWGFTSEDLVINQAVTE